LTYTLVATQPIQGGAWDRIISESLPQLKSQWNTDRTLITSFLQKFASIYTTFPHIQKQVSHQYSETKASLILHNYHKVFSTTMALTTQSTTQSLDHLVISNHPVLQYLNEFQLNNFFMIKRWLHHTPFSWYKL
jgi:hypothetical protein